MASIPGKYADKTRLAGWIAIGLPVLAVLFKLGLLSAGVFPFNSDEAIVGLMARPTLRGEWPIFFYGQAYMGSLDASLAAAGFALFGERVLIIRLIQAVLYSGTVWTTILLARRMFDSQLAGVAAGLLLAIPATNVTLYTTVSLGGYGEALLLGNLILLAAWDASGAGVRLGRVAILGFLAGLGFWTFGLTLVYTLPALFVVLWALRGRRRARQLKSILILAAAGLLGVAPVILWAGNHGLPALLSELAGSAIAGTAGAGALRLLHNARNLLLFGSTVLFGLRPPWDVRPLFAPGLVLAVAFWLVVALAAIRRRLPPAVRPGGVLVSGVAVLTLLGYLLTPFGGDPSGRYFLPLSIVLAIIAGGFTARASWPRLARVRWALLAGLVVFQFGTNLAAAVQAPGFTTQFDAATRIDHGYDDDLIAFLKSVDATRGYSTYWVGYPLAFESREEIIYVPALPYHADLRFTERDNRYAPYGAAVAASSRVSFITTGQPRLEGTLEDFLRGQGVSWMEAAIGPYHVYYGLSGAIDIDLLKAMWLE